MDILIGHEGTLIIAWSDRHRGDLRDAPHHTPTSQTFLSPAKSGGDQSNQQLDDQVAGCRGASAARAASTGNADAGCLQCFVTGIGASRCRTAECDRPQRRSDPLSRRM